MMVEEKEPVSLFASFLFPRIFQTFRMAIQPTKLILAFLGVTTVCLAGRVMDLNQTVVVKVDADGQQTTELDEFVDPGGAINDHIALFGPTGQRAGVFITLWRFQSTQFHGILYSILKYEVDDLGRHIELYFQAWLWALFYHPVYTVIFFSVILIVGSLVGGAICRIAALQFAQGEKPGIGEALRFAARKFHSFLTAPITPVGIMIVTGLFVVVLGLVGKIPYLGELSIGLFLPIALLSAALTAIIAIGAVAGLNLMFPTIAYEDSDCFDAISRSFSYVYAKPWHMGFYTSVAVIYGAICYVFVRSFAFLVLTITHVSLRVGLLGNSSKMAKIWPAPRFAELFGAVAVAPGNWSTAFCAFLVKMWVLAIVGLVVSFVISFYFSANTVIYALMRHRVDKTALEEVYTVAGEFTTGPAPITESKPDGTGQ